MWMQKIYKYVKLCPDIQCSLVILSLINIINLQHILNTIIKSTILAKKFSKNKVEIRVLQILQQQLDLDLLTVPPLLA